MVERLRRHPLIEGVYMGGQTHKVALYADDLLLAITKPRSSLPPLLEELEQFGEAYGFKVNPC